jgi:hypothetical protein
MVPPSARYSSTRRVASLVFLYSAVYEDIMGHGVGWSDTGGLRVSVHYFLKDWQVGSKCTYADILRTCSNKELS